MVMDMSLPQYVYKSDEGHGLYLQLYFKTIRMLWRQITANDHVVINSTCFRF